ncbi:F-box/kelch-repeat protein OR23 [Hibiscus syriacus]|uniref:F-box/kelch-repeat protein OR23 n=1 Tax=Hibiscus syriacus TaxID=106335 RepID=A0A6A2XF31_HIBSY|nr:F-box/kelch-repeat protein OR23 [Hibiscus syriacus]
MSILSTSPSANLHEIDDAQTLIPGLPNDVAALILSFLPYSHHCRLKPTCKPWYIFLSSKTLLSLRRRNRSSHLLCIFPEDPHISSPFLFDPEHLAWCPLPPMPCNPHVYGLCNFTSISLGPHIYVLGGSLFDTRTFPLDRPSPSSSAFRYNFVTSSWDRLAPMISPRGSFACAAIPSADQIIVAGGGSRHTMFRAGGSRICSVERYDVEKDQWEALDGLPRFRAGCVGFTVIGDGEEREFWVMGGKMGMGSGGKLGICGEQGETPRFGKIAVVEDEEGGNPPAIFMLDDYDILIYNMDSNRWQKECSVPRRTACETSFGFIVMNGELHVMTIVNGIDSTETRRSRQQKRTGTLFIQIYHPKKKTWRFLITKLPFRQPLDLSTTVMCPFRL